MPSDKPKIVIRTTQEIIDKLDIIAKNENRSRGNMGEKIIEEYINNYEKRQGKINTNNLSVSKIG